MSTDEKTDPQGPLPKLMTRLFTEFEAKLMERFDELEKRFLVVHGAYEHRVRECEREIANLKELVFGEDFQKVLRFARAASSDTEPPPPSGMQS